MGGQPAHGEPDRPLGDVVKHTLVYGSGFVTLAAVSLVLTPIYTHQLTPAEFGLLALMLVLYGLMKQIYDLGFTNSVGRFYFDAKGSTGEGSLGDMRATSMAFLAAYGGILTAVLIGFASEWSQLLTGDRSHDDLVRIVAVTLYADALSSVPLTLIRMQERARLYVLITVARFSLTLVLSVLFVAGQGWGVRGALLGNAIPAVAVLVLLLPDYRRALAAAPSLALLRRMLSFGLPFFPVLLSVWVIDASDRYLLELLRSREEVGTYSLAYRVAQVMQIAVAAFSLGWAPLRYRIYERPDASDLYRRLASHYVLAASALAVGLALFAREVVALIAPPDYAAAAGVVPLLVLAYATFGLYLMMVTGMGVTKRTAPMAGVAAAGATVNVALNVLLIPRWGMHAAAATTVLANAVMAAGAWWYSQRAYPIPYQWGRMGAVALLAAVVVAAAALVSPASHVGRVVLASVGWLAFVGALVATGALPRDDVAALGQRMRQVTFGRRARRARHEAGG